MSDAPDNEDDDPIYNQVPTENNSELENVDASVLTLCDGGQDTGSPTGIFKDSSCTSNTTSDVAVCEKMETIPANDDTSIQVPYQEISLSSFTNSTMNDSS